MGRRCERSAQERRQHRGKRLQRAAVAAVVLGGTTLVLRRRGWSVGGNTVVRCRDGHLFTSIWVPGVSVKSVRLGWWRLQRCPVGAHWTLVSPVKDADLTPEELQAARAVKDVRVP